MSRFDYLRDKKEEIAKIRERNWDNRFYLEKIPKFDAFADKEDRYLNLSLRNIKRGYFKDLLKQEEEKKKYGNKRAQYTNSNLSKGYSTFNRTNENQDNLYSRTQSNWNERYGNENGNSQNNTIKYKFKPKEKYQIDASQSQNELNFTKSNDLKMSTQEFNKKKLENRNKGKIFYSSKSINKEEDKFNNEQKNKIESLKKTWKDFGVTKEFQKTFEHSINTLMSEIKNYENEDDIEQKQNAEKELLELIDNEKTQLKNFKKGLLNLKKAISEREKEIENIKNLDNYYYLNKKEIEKNRKKREKENKKKEENENKRAYLEENDSKDYKNMENLTYKQFLDEQIKTIKNELENNNSDISENENDNKNKKKEQIKNAYEINHNKILNDAISCLKNLRIESVNVVNLMNKFREEYNYQITSGKFNMDILDDNYAYDRFYLTKMKNDLDFLNTCHLKNEFNFKEEGNDPFLLNIAEDENEENKKNKKKKKKKKKERRK